MKRVTEQLTGQPKLIQDVSILCCKKYSRSQLREIGEYFGKSGPAISQVVHRLSVKAEKDEALKALISLVEDSFKK